jgi:carbamoyltransferase
MKILGLCNGKDSGAALIIGNKVVASVNEERFTRQKLTREFPKNSIEYVLRAGQITLDEVNLVGCGAWNGIDRSQVLPKLVDDILELSQGLEASGRKIISERIRATIHADNIAKQQLSTDLLAYGIPKEKVINCDHHLSHALAAYYPSPFEDAVVLTADGRGDFRSLTIWEANRTSGLTLIDSGTELTSLGAMYGFVTNLLGFTPDRHEGKLTGLAAHGKKTEIYHYLKKGIYFCEQSGRIKTSIGEFYKPFVTAKLPTYEALLDRIAPEDFAFAAQSILEETLTKYLDFKLKSLGRESVDLCLSGGCMANVKLNYELMKLPQVSNIYVSPAMGDGGNALGGAINIATSVFDAKYIEMKNVYLGPSYCSDEIRSALLKNKLTFKELKKEERIETAANLLAENHVIGWFQGRMEFGPRALGNRSILASASSPDTNRILNERLNRTEFMPFAPVTIDSIAELCYVEWSPTHECANFMTMCYKCTDKMKNLCPAVVHVDSTARPQIIKRLDNQDYYDLVKYYYEITGQPALINTSFNNHEDPIVLSPQDAINSYRNANVDFLFIGDFLIGEK